MISSVSEDEDFYFEGGYLVMTERYHLKRGYCCGSGCRHCPYSPRHRQGSTRTGVAAGELTIASSTPPDPEDDQKI